MTQFVRNVNNRPSITTPVLRQIDPMKSKLQMPLLLTIIAVGGYSMVPSAEAKTHECRVFTQDPSDPDSELKEPQAILQGLANTEHPDGFHGLMLLNSKTGQLEQLYSERRQGTIGLIHRDSKEYKLGDIVITFRPVTKEDTVGENAVATPEMVGMMVLTVTTTKESKSNGQTIVSPDIENRIVSAGTMDYAYIYHSQLGLTVSCKYYE